MGEPLKEQPWHHLHGEKALALLDADLNAGLDRSEAENRLCKYGPNALKTRKGKGPLRRFLEQFDQALVYILLVAVIIKLALGAYVDAGVIFGVVMLNSVIGFCTRFALLLLAGSFGLFEWALQRGASQAEARTIAVNVIAIGQTFYLLNCRPLRFSIIHIGLFSNMWIWGGIAAMIITQLAFTYAPVMNRLFHTAPIGLTEWLQILGVGLVIYIVVGVEKAYRRKMEIGEEL